MWVHYPKPNPHASLRLICFPYAGAGASLYYPWSYLLPNFIEVCSIQLPGRENRVAEPCYTHFSQLIPVLAQALHPHLQQPFAFFGHSMGGLLAFEVARYIRKHFALSPHQLYASGIRPPHITSSIAAVSHLPPSLFMTEVQRRYGGFSTAVWQEPELMRLLVPILRADFATFESYRYSEDMPLECPLVVFGGWQDNLVDYHDLAAWSKHTTQSFTLKMFSGDHFFVRSASTEVLRTLVEHMTAVPVALS